MENAGGKKNIVKQLLYCHDVLGVHYSMAKSNGKTEKLSRLRLQAEGWGTLGLAAQTSSTLLTAAERCVSSNKHFAPTDYVYLNSGGH